MSGVLVIGTGSIGMRHLRAFAAIGGSSSPIAMPIRAGRAGSPELAGFRVVESLERAAELAVDAAVIATDTRRHVDDALGALSIGCDVLVEKPLAPSASALGALGSSAARAGRSVYVGCCLRFHSALRRFRAELPRIGEIHDVRIECRSYLPEWRPERDYRQSYSARAEDGGVLRDIVHEIDYAVWLFGAPRRLFARLVNTGRLGIPAEEIAAILWESPSGGVVSMHLDYLSRAPRRFVRASGTEGCLEVDLIAQRVSHQRPDGAVSTWDEAQSRDKMMEAQARTFLESDRERRVAGMATFEEGAFALALCDAARRSSLSGHVEEIVS